MTELHLSLREIPMPPAIARLPLDARGFPVPWFVALVEGQPDHRIVEGTRFAPALKEQRCWICGEKLGRFRAFILGPMCVVSRTVSEPPSHRDCALYALRACPFLSRPHASRREVGKPAEAVEAAGIPIQRNPGVLCLWITRSVRVFQPSKGNPGLLFQVGEPTETSWYREGRRATRTEVLESLESGLPLQQPLAQQQGPAAERAYALAVVRALQYVPQEDPVHA